MSTQFVVSLIFGLLAFFGIDWNVIRGLKNVTSRNRQRFLLAMIIASLITSGVGWYRTRSALPPSAGQYMTSWGSDTPFNPKNPLLRVVADGNLLYRFRHSYKAGAVAFHYYGLLDINDTPGLQKSALYDIEHGPITMRIKPDAQFIEAVNKGQRNTQYALLLVPKNVQMNQFAVLQQAKSLGVVVVQITAGPP